MSTPEMIKHKLLNEEAPWNRFDSEEYLSRNYSVLRDDDRQIIEVVRDFFSEHFRGGRRVGAGVDVGAGTNLYPTFAMLPVCDSITLREYSVSNVQWLERELAAYSDNWDQFWKVYAERDLYSAGRIDDPRAVVRRNVQVEEGSVFELPENNWDVGTMFFVAESLSDYVEEFEEAVTAFVKALRPGAPFAAAFMRVSTGYDIGIEHFPAVAVKERDIVDYFAGAEIEALRTFGSGTSGPLREGYDDHMMVVVGTVAR